MQVRELSDVDASAVAELFARSRSASMPWLPVLHSSQEDREFFGAQLRDGTGIGVDQTGTLVGFAIARDGWLDQLYVTPAKRGQGIGTTLVTAVRRRIPGDLRLWVFTRNTAALGFYRGLGAVDEEYTDGANNEEREPDVRLRLPADDTLRAPDTD